VRKTIFSVLGATLLAVSLMQTAVAAEHHRATRRARRYPPVSRRPTTRWLCLPRRKRTGSTGGLAGSRLVGRQLCVFEATEIEGNPKVQEAYLGGAGRVCQSGCNDWREHPDWNRV